MNIPLIDSARRIRSRWGRVVIALLFAGVLALGTIVYSGCGVMAMPLYPVTRAMDKAAEAHERAGRRRLPVVPEAE